MGFEKKVVWRKKLAEKALKFKPETLADSFFRKSLKNAFQALPTIGT
jgi:hypothetical protein